MLKQIATLFALLSLPLTASASAGLALDWGQRASGLYQQTTRMIYQIDHGVHPKLEETYLIELERFALTAERLSAWSYDTTARTDLGCIYHDISLESERQKLILDSQRTESDKREALRQLAIMFMDAKLIAAAASRDVALPTEASLKPRLACAVTKS